MKFLIEAEVVERHPEGLTILAINNGFGSPHVQFAPGTLNRPTMPATDTTQEAATEGSAGQDGHVPTVEST